LFYSSIKHVFNLHIIIGLSRWARGVADVNGRGSGSRHHTGGKQRAWTDDVRRPAAVAGEGRGRHGA